MDKAEEKHIEFNGHKYWYKYKLAKNGDSCLATKDPQKYCNGFFRYSDKDPGDGMEYVIIKSNQED